MISQVNNILSLLTILGDVILGGALVFYLLERWSKKEVGAWRQAKKIVGKHGLVFALIVALIATLGSLFFSEVAQYNPCKLCWWQRIFMYPQVILLWVAVMSGFKKEIRVYAISLSSVGALISTYHY